MNKEYMRKLFEVLGQIDDLAEPLKEKQEQQEKRKQQEEQEQQEKQEEQEKEGQPG